ncbi:MAG: polyphenol oxidase family protein [Bdellovibrionales bacterium]|nr:polyphenol oxidase family protein [Bdellovibrionales bacterium]
MSFETVVSSAQIDLASTSHVKQVHGRKVLELESRHAQQTEALAEADGLMLRNGAILDYPKALAIKSADCAPLIYIDRERQHVAAIHAGWRGLAQGIHRVPFENGFNPKTTWVWIGPCLNGHNFEVGEDLWAQFPRYCADATVFAPGAAVDKKYFFTWEYLRREFGELGVELIYNVEVDTFDARGFASFRRYKKQGGDPAKGVPRNNISWVGFRRPVSRPSG